MQVLDFANRHRDEYVGSELERSEFDKWQNCCKVAKLFSSSINSGLASFHNNMAELFLFLGFSEWEDESILAAVLAESQKEYLEKLKKGAVKEKCSDEDSKS